MENIPQPSVQVPAPSLFEKKWVRVALLASATILLLYGMIVLDVVLRARDACLEGQKYERWAERPEEKKAALDAQYETEKQKLDEQLASQKISRDEYDRQMEILGFDREFKMGESSIKYAYVWYQTAYELFSPPESKWVKLARERAPLVKEKWKAELRSKKIPFEDTMLE